MFPCSFQCTIREKDNIIIIILIIIIIMHAHTHMHTCTERSAKNNHMSMYPRLSPRKTASPFYGTYPSTLTGPSQLIGRALC